MANLPNLREYLASERYAAISATFVPSPPAKVGINTSKVDSAASSMPAPNPSNGPQESVDALMANKGYGKDEYGPKTLKLVLVGDTCTGKTCLITNYLNNTFSDIYEPTVLDVYEGTKSVAKKQMKLEIHDTSGDDNLTKNRRVQYQGADVFIICVSCN